MCFSALLYLAEHACSRDRQGANFFAKNPDSARAARQKLATFLKTPPSHRAGITWMGLLVGLRMVFEVSSKLVLD